jgi:hypothetical protein
VRVAAALLLISCVIVARRLSRSPLATVTAVLFLVVAGTLTVCGYAASAFHRLNDGRVWIAGSALVLAAAVLVAGRRVAPDADRTGRTPGSDLDAPATFDRLLIVPMIAATAIAGILNAVVALVAAPHAWDALTYHLTRVAYYLQHNSFDFYDANYWAQVVHPLGSTALMAYTFLATGNEHVAALWQYAAYWITVVTVFGVAIESGHTRRQALFAALLFALFTQSLMQASVPENDVLLAACGAIVVYALLRYRRDRSTVTLAVAAAACAIGIGIKASFVLNLPLFAASAVFALRGDGGVDWRAWMRLAICAIAATLLFVLPSGYLTNMRRFGSPLGPETVREEHAMTGRPIAFQLREGTKNVLRFGLNFVSLDGFPRLTIVNRAQDALHALPAFALPKLGIDLEHPDNGERGRFLYERIASAHEVHSYWGVLGFALVWWSVIAAAFDRRARSEVRLLAWLTIGFLLMQSYFSIYDQWRGRYFLTAGAFAAPVAARWFSVRTPFARAYVVAIVWVACLSAITAVVLRSNRMLVSVRYEGYARPSIFQLDRIGQMMQNRPGYEDAVRRFESLVAPDATVAVYLEPASFEYPLFGEGLTRRLMPINSFRSGRQPIPADADVLVFSSTLEAPRDGDVHLGADWYLRRLRIAGAEQRQH